MSQKISKKFEKLITNIPGYNPLDDAKGFWFDEDVATNVLNFFEHPQGSYLRHVEDSTTALAGDTFILQDWQRAILINAFSWKHKKTNLRRYREVFLFVPRKNGKTTLVSGILLYILMFDNENGAKCYSSAGCKEQASLIFNAMSGMVRQEEWLSGLLQILPSSKTIYRADTMSSYKAIPADSKNLHGLNIHALVNDELHVHQNRKVIDALMSGRGARRQPIVFHTTTSDFNGPSICNEMYDYACKIRDGILKNSAYLPVIYEASKEDDWTSEETWYKANPNLGISYNLVDMREECQKAIDIPSYENTFKRLHLNIRTEQDVRWIKMSAWDECGGEIDEDELVGCPCWGGLDLANKTDVAAWILLFPPHEKRKKWNVLCRFFVPRDNAEVRSKKDNSVEYLTWGKEGYITLTDGNVIDYAFIQKQIEDDGAKFEIVEIGVDKWNVEQLRQQLSTVGAKMREVVQGYQMSGANKELEKFIIGKEINHGNNPVLRWMASNVSIKTDPYERIMLDRDKSSEKIDGIVALCIALARYLKGNAKKISVYSKRGLITV